MIKKTPRLESAHTIQHLINKMKALSRQQSLMCRPCLVQTILLVSGNTLLTITKRPLKRHTGQSGNCLLRVFVHLANLF